MSARPARGRWRRRLLRLFLLSVLLVVLFGAGVLWRLTRGPISLDFLTPWVVDALQPADGSFTVAIGTTEMVWTQSWYDVDLRVRDVDFADRGGTKVASFPELSMELSVPALLHGELAPREIELVGPQLRLVREADGSIGLGLGLQASAGGGTSVLQRLLAGDENDEQDAPAAEWLRTIVVRDGGLALTDRASGFETSAQGVAVDVRRETTGLDVELAAELVLGAERIPVRVQVEQAQAPTPTRLHLTFADVQPAALVQATSALVPETGSIGDAISSAAANVGVPLEGSLTLLLEGTEVQRVDADVTGGAGSLWLPPPWSQQVPVDRLAIGGAYDVQTAKATLRALEIDLGIPVLRIAGDWTNVASGGALTATASVVHVPVDQLSRYWPPGAAVAARTWITRNITGGRVASANAALKAELALGAATSFTLRGLDGRVSYENLTVRYVDTMPEATRVTGTATFSPDAWSFRVASASVAALTVPGAKVEIGGLGSGSPHIAIDAQAKGTVRDALLLIDHEPLRYAREIGVDPSRVGGTLTGRVQLAFPLGGAPMPHDLGAVVEASLRGATLPHAVGDWPMTDGNLQVKVAKETLTVSGTAVLTGVPCSVEWHERLGAATGVTRTIDVQSDVDAEGRAALGFDLRPWVTGPVAVKAHVEQRHDGKGTAKLDLNLGQTTLAAPELRIEKAAGTPGTASGTLALAGSTITAVDPFSFDAAGASANGKATLKGGGFASVQLRGELPPGPKGGERPDFALTVDPAPVGNRFKLTSEDASTLLRVLMPETRTSGGDLLFTGNVAKPPRGWTIDGSLAVRSFTLTESPTLARLLTLASLSGIVSALRDTGIAFDSLTSGITYDAGAVTFADGVVTGPSLRLLMAGTVDAPKDSITLNGTLVPPLYGLNTLPGKIPLIGGLFGGGDGEGLIAIDFTVRGPLKDPSVSVQPLNSLAPGVLRKFVRKVPSW